METMTSKAPVFKDATLQQQFDRDGFVVVPFQDLAGVEEMQKIFLDFHPEFNSEHGFYSSTFSPDLEYKRKLFERMDAQFKDSLNQYFKDYQPLGSSFLVKQPGQQGMMPIHQDWTIVDEDRYRSVTIWVPLIDTNEQNGAIKVLRGSHEYTRILRGPTLPTVFDNVQDLIEDRMETLIMKAGDAFIFDHSLIHSSHLNQSDENRIAITYGLVPEEAQLCYYYKAPDASPQEVEYFEMDRDFFFEFYDNKVRPQTGKSLGMVSTSFPKVNKAKFLNMVEGNSNGNNNGKTVAPLFKDEAIQKQFDDKGYTSFPLLDEEDIKELLDFYKSLNNDHVPEFGFHVSLDNKNDGFAEKVIAKLKSVIGPKLEGVCQDYQIFIGSFVVKEANPYSVVPPHQDWSFVDETEFCSATLWIPLVDVDMDNGALAVVEGSHKYFDHPRASPAPQFKAPFDDHMFSVFPYMQLKPMKAGSALVFNNRTMHGSPPNTTDAPRIAAGVGITQKNARFLHYYMVPGQEEEQVKKIERYSIQPEFLLEHNNGHMRELYGEGKHPEQGKLEGHYYYDSTPADVDELLEKIKADGNVVNMPMIEKLAKIFNYNLDGTPKESTVKNEDHQDVPAETIEVDEAVVKEVREQADVQVQAEANGQQHENGEAKEEWVWVDDRSFFQKYTPANILKEIGIKLKTYSPKNIIAEIKYRLRKN